MPPKLLISDTSLSPPITTEYNHGENVLNFKTIYTAIKQLHKHSGKGILITYTNPLSPLPLSLLRPCSKEFLDTYWALFAQIIDYFADFASEDSATMQSLWFHLLDVLECVAKGLPHEFWRENALGQATISCEHAKEFAEQYSQTTTFLHEVINARTVRNSVPILHSTLRTHEPPTSYPGAFKAGLNPWQQFLLNGAPGFEVPKSARKYRDDDPFEKYPHGRRIVREHQVPFGALGIVAKHIGRLRHAAIEIASVNFSLAPRFLLMLENRNTDNSQDGAELRSSAETLDEFDSHVLKPGHTFAYTSISGRRTVVQHVCPFGALRISSRWNSSPDIRRCTPYPPTLSLQPALPATETQHVKPTILICISWMNVSVRIAFPSPFPLSFSYHDV
jgi:hypothetical protein